MYSAHVTNKIGLDLKMSLKDEGHLKTDSSYFIPFVSLSKQLDLRVESFSFVEECDRCSFFTVAAA